MKFRLLTAALLAQFFLCGPSLSAESRKLLVMLQGSSADEITELVERAGGSVTHDLHIINAVGARMTSTQLDEVMQSPLITRVIDDLEDDTPQKSEDEDVNCRVRGHIELDFTADGISWPLYNKLEAPAFLETLELSWPARLGPVKNLTVAGINIEPTANAAQKHSVKIDFPKARRPEIKDKVFLTANFETFKKGATAETPLQSEFTIKANFTGDCPTKLVPGYANNHEDFYYNTVGGVDALHRQGITGKGVTIAVIDSGLWEHEALTNDTSGKNRLIGRYDALTDTADAVALDESGHGTHMTSIIAHSGPTLRDGKPTGTYKGVAPDANIVAVKVLDREGFAHLLDIVRAVQWVVDNRERLNIKVLNLSFSQVPRWIYWEDPVDQAVMQAWRSGIAVVAAAGNEGPKPETIGSPGNLPNIITVGALTDSWTPNNRDDDYIPDFSSQGPTPAGHVKPDVVSLGGHMTGLIRPSSALATNQPEDILRTGEFVSTGSSQATAFVSGILALLLQLEPELSPNNLKCKLITSAEPAINQDGLLSYSPFQQGYGFVGATRAVTLGESQCASQKLETAGEPSTLRKELGPTTVGINGEPLLDGLGSKVSQTPSAKGLSKTRSWGVKSHIEKKYPIRHEEIDPDGIDAYWMELYLLEKAAIKILSARP
ncbi:MAG: serine protease AprX [Halioglobus sp.]|jgi:serine protease AprX